MWYRGWLLVLLIGLPGCAIHDPYRVRRFTFDFNSERELALQTGVYDHLPPKPIPVRLMKWGYNVGPSPDRGTPGIPANSPVKPEQPPLEGVLPGGTFDDYEEPPPPLWPLRPAVPWQPPLPPYPMFPPQPGFGRPEVFPPPPNFPRQPLSAPVSPQVSPQESEGPTASGQRVPLSAARQNTSGTYVTPAGWMFAAP